MFDFKDLVNARLEGFTNSTNTNWSRLLEHTQSITYLEEYSKMTQVKIDKLMENDIFKQ